MTLLEKTILEWKVTNEVRSTSMRDLVLGWASPVMGEKAQVSQHW
jgi:hypothetical protein